MVDLLNGHFRNLNWRYLAYIWPKKKAYVRGYPQKILPYMVQYLQFRILRFPLVYPLVNVLHSCGKWPFIVDFPMKNGGSFHSYVNVYQRVRENLQENLPETIDFPKKYMAVSCKFFP